MRRTRDLDKINELLHFLKATGPFNLHLTEMQNDHSHWNAFNKKKIINPSGYLSDIEIITLLHWIEKYILCCKFLDHRRYYVDEMGEMLSSLQSPALLDTIDRFDEILFALIDKIEFADKYIIPKLNRISCSESMRLDESLVCFENHSFYASVIMAVSAVENRLLEIIKRFNEELFLESFVDMTLGQLIQVFEPDKYKDEKYKPLKNLMPPQHRPLLSLLNHYRIFSAHPKEEKITAQVAESIIHLSFAFIMDEKTCPYDEEELACGAP